LQAKITKLEIQLVKARDEIMKSGSQLDEKEVRPKSPKQAKNFGI